MKKIGFLITFSIALLSFSSSLLSQSAQESDEIAFNLNMIFENLNESGASTGAIIASPSRTSPDYYFHWVRDAGLTVATLVDKKKWDPRIEVFVNEWVQFERHLQKEALLRGQSLGEPKFHVDGSVFQGPWGRPQNDGPAIRSWAYLRAYAKNDDLVEIDLAYLKAHWRDADFDLWEETKGHHFFTRYSQMAAFDKASSVYEKLNPVLSRSYYLEARSIENSLSEFIDNSRNLVLPTIGLLEGVSKPSGLDVSVILAPTYFGDSLKWSVSHNQIMSTALRIEEEFRRLYTINSQFQNLAPGIGRYPEDVYDGNGFTGGNPWFLATLGFAEYYCALIESYSAQREIDVNEKNWEFFRAAVPKINGFQGRVKIGQKEYRTLLLGLQNKANSFLQRVKLHSGQDRFLSEQFDRQNGYRRGARDLTWSYAAAVRAIDRCSATEKSLSLL